MNSRIVFLVLLSLAFQFPVSKPQRTTYIGAVVEYEPYQNADKKKMLVENLKSYKTFIESAKKKEADIIVFPEGGLKTDVLSKIPNPAESKIVPCDNKLNEFTEVLTTLSCAAKDNQIYVVVNVPESRSVETTNDNVKTDRIFNTNVVFDRNGTVVSRYAKYNLFDEFNTSRPDQPELSFFTSDFGVQFGTFICFDILFQEPALLLVRQFGITDFLFTSQWFSELPFLSALQVQRGWAEANNVNLLASGYNNPRVGSTGSGIFNGFYGSLGHYMGEKSGSQLIVAEIPIKHRNFGGSDSRSWNSIMKNSFARENKLNSAFDTFYLLSDQIELFHSAVIQPGLDTELQLCSHRNFCCEFHIRLDKLTKDTKGYNYRAVAFNGVRRFGLKATGGVQACGVILCSGPRIANCTKRGIQASGLYEFSFIKIQGTFRKRNSLQIPTTLTTGENMDALKPNHYEFVAKEEEDAKKVKMTLDWSVSNLQTFAIWGRDFTTDGRKPSPPVSKAPSLKSIPLPTVILVTYIVLRSGY